MKKLSLGIWAFVFFVMLLAVWYLVSGDYVWAAGTENLSGVDLTVEGLFNIITGLVCWLTRVAGAVMVIFIILAGFRFMNARGNPTAFENAKKNFNHVLIGVLVILGVYVIIATVASAVGVTDFSFIPLVC